jgi:Rps23 Pro-64 3,4-dihydroxylase Tpa1-like proline 4-hydroxylase
MISKENLIAQLKAYGKDGPFDHCVIENFFDTDYAKKLESEFLDFDSDLWHEYNNSIEIKKTSNNWNLFPADTYSAFSYLNSREFVDILEEHVFKSNALFADDGLNAGGWHIHKSGGKLNTHLDYNIHPKLGLQRKLNIIIYLNSNWQDDWGGELGFWGNETDAEPGELQKAISPKFNRAVLFDTTQNSWHGLRGPVNSPDGQNRKSLAVYYLCEPEENTSDRGKALFSPSEDQKNDADVLDLIKLRSGIDTASSVWKKKK